jgi:hypothetical protein
MFTREKPKAIEPALIKVCPGERGGGPGSDIYCDGSCKEHAVPPGRLRGCLAASYCTVN